MGAGSSSLIQISQPMKKASFAAMIADPTGETAPYPDEVDTINTGDELVVYTWPTVNFQSFSGNNVIGYGYSIGFQNLSLYGEE